MKNNVPAANKKRNATLTKAISAAASVSASESGTDFPDELLNKKVEDITPEEIAFMHDSNENFVGKEINPKRVAVYNEMLALAAQFAATCDQFLDMIRFDPASDRKTAAIYIDLSVYPSFNRETAAILSELYAKADYGTMAQSTNGGIRIGFGIKNVWLK